MADPPIVTPVRSRPAIPPPIRVRRSVVSLPLNDPIMTFYGRAITEMRSKPISDPVSWRFQAAIHDYPRDGVLDAAPAFAQRREEDPFASSSETLPSTTDQRRFWRQCQHFTWFFLPWHRMYIHHFEKMIMSHVIRLGGPTDWALPYWNYSASAAAAQLPVHFRDRIVNGAANPLFIEQRDSRANAGASFLTGSQTDIAGCLAEASFAASGGSPGFGGPRTVTANHDAAVAFGALEATPHGAIHVGVSGPAVADASSPSGRVRRGFMASFTRAPLDPIFWLHHCNVDRLWKVWLRDPAHSNPTTADWLTAVPFSFHNAAGAIVDMKSADVLDTRPAPLSYIYDDEP
jgi:tyrosinase